MLIIRDKRSIRTWCLRRETFFFSSWSPSHNSEIFVLRRFSAYTRIVCVRARMYMYTYKRSLPLACLHYICVSDFWYTVVASIRRSLDARIVLWYWHIDYYLSPEDRKYQRCLCVCVCVYSHTHTHSNTVYSNLHGFVSMRVSKVIIEVIETLIQ